MKIFIEWLEKNPARTRKVVLLMTVAVFLVITVCVFVAPFFGFAIQSNMVTLYGTLAAFMVGIYGFFTGTSSDKSSELADKAANIMMDKLDNR
jgi:nitrogen fixation-related uncharacterized protein